MQPTAASGVIHVAAAAAAVNVCMDGWAGGHGMKRQESDGGMRVMEGWWGKTPAPAAS